LRAARNQRLRPCRRRDAFGGERFGERIEALAVARDQPYRMAIASEPTRHGRAHSRARADDDDRSALVAHA
jgi:hypothetical protein